MKSENSSSTVDCAALQIASNATIRQAMTCLEQTQVGITLVVDSSKKLLGTITDGDIRRAILAGVHLDTPVHQLLATKANSSRQYPITAPPGTAKAEILRLMNEHKVRQIPLLDEQGRVVGIDLLDEISRNEALPIRAVIMAGGKGTRLRPLTEGLPKPMLPVGDKPLMERIIKQLRHAGIRHVNVTVNYKREQIIGYFGDGNALGVKLNYVTEEQPLGTAGALGFLGNANEPLLVINGDILTRVDFAVMLKFHQDNRSDLTVGVRQFDMQVPYGVVEADGPIVRRIREKPSYSFLVNAGIYLLEPSVWAYIPQNQHFDMTDLIESLLQARRTVISFPIIEYWLDIGKHEDYEKAQKDARDGRLDQ